jgi:hypothetical protein
MRYIQQYILYTIYSTYTFININTYSTSIRMFSVYMHIPVNSRYTYILTVPYM